LRIALAGATTLIIGAVGAARSATAPAPDSSGVAAVVETRNAFCRAALKYRRRHCGGVAMAGCLAIALRARIVPPSRFTQALFTAHELN